MSASRIPSPPIAPCAPGSPVFQHRSPSSPDSSSQLYQHLQRLHLTRGAGSPTFRRSSPPNLSQLGTADSPPHSFPNLLQNFSQPHQRNSPPPNFQNLHMIKEDSLDLDRSSQSDSEEDMMIQENDDSATHSADNRTLQVKQRAFACKPQISITDTHGHVTAVTSDGDSESDKGDNSDSAAVSPNSPATSPSSVPLSYSYSVPFGTNIHTNLANIPPEISYSGPLQDVSKTSNVNWYSPHSPHHRQPLRGLRNSTNFDSLSNFNAHSEISSHKGWEISSEGIVGVYENSSQSGERTATPTNFPVNEECELKTVGSLLNVSSKRSVEDILSEIRKILEHSSQHIAYQCSENCFQLANSDVAMEVEVCEGVEASRLQVRRISGDRGCYQQLCRELLGGINI